MAEKILVTTMATRMQAVSVDTQVIEIADYHEAVRAVDRINDQGRQFLDSALFKQTAVPLTFRMP